MGSCNVKGTHKPLFSVKFLLKMGLTILFIHLKIILLQCFQFLVFSKKQYLNRPLEKEKEKEKHILYVRSVAFRLRLGTTFASVFAFFFFFSRVCETCDYCSCIVHKQQPQSLTFLTFFSQSVHSIYYSWTHKFHFSVNFSLKISHTVLFTHLKIILLQQFSVFSFNFQFSAISKRTLNIFSR